MTDPGKGVRLLDWIMTNGQGRFKNIRVSFKSTIIWARGEGGGGQVFLAAHKPNSFRNDSKLCRSIALNNTMETR